MFCLWFDRIPGFDPCGKTTQDGGDAGIAVLQKEERRTSARMLAKSGAVGDDPLVFVESHLGGIYFDLVQRKADRTGDVTRAVGIHAAYIHRNGVATLDGNPGFFQ